MDNFSAALAAMEGAVREHCPGLTEFTVRLQFDDEEGANTFTREFPISPAPVHDARTGVISSAIGEVVARVVHRTPGVPGTQDQTFPQHTPMAAGQAEGGKP